MTEDVPSLGETPSSFHRGTGHPAGPSLLSPCPGCVCGFLSSRGALLGLAVMVGRAWGPWVRQGRRPEPTALQQPASAPPLEPSACPAPRRAPPPLSQRRAGQFSVGTVNASALVGQRVSLQPLASGLSGRTWPWP